MLLIGPMPRLCGWYVLCCLALCGACGDDVETGSGSGGGAGTTASSGGASGSSASGSGGTAGSSGTGGSSGGSAGSNGGSGGGSSLCRQGCELTIAADCEDGPASQAQCEQDCEELMSGRCGAEYQALQACAVGEPITCGPAGIPVIEGCSSEQDTFIDCLNGV